MNSKVFTIIFKSSLFNMQYKKMSTSTIRKSKINKYKIGDYAIKSAITLMLYILLGLQLGTQIGCSNKPYVSPGASKEGLGNLSTSKGNKKLLVQCVFKC